MKFRTTVICSKCQQPFAFGAASGFVCFKIPRKEGYLFFHRGSPGADCWEAYIKENSQK